MSGLTKKTGKPKTRKPVKRAESAVRAVETPVLFRLPDLSNLPETTISGPTMLEPTIAASMGVTTDAKPILTSDPTMAAQAGSDSEVSPKPPAASRFTHFASTSVAAAKRNLVPAAKTALVVAGRAAVMPYVAPTGLLAASLLITLVVIYGPFGGNKPTLEGQPQASSAEAATMVAKAEQPKEETKQPATVASEKRQLKKIANELDEQLLTQATNEATEDDTVDVSIANAESSLPPADDESEPESFTEPWSRKKPSRTVAVAKAEMESDEDEGALEDNRRQVARRTSDEMTDVEEDEEVEAAPPKKTAPRSRQSREALEAELEEELEAEMEEREETPAPKKQYKSRYAEEDSLEDLTARPAATDRRLAAERPEGDEEPINPWKRIRNERLEREPSREMPIAKKEAPKSKGNGEYRSPAGQDIELDPEWFDETASRPRGETQRTSPR